MAKKKAELKAAHELYSQHSLASRRLEQNHQYSESLNEAVRSLQHLQDACAYQRRFHKNKAIPRATLERILSLAPPLFDLSALAHLSAFYSALNRSERKAYTLLPQQLRQAKRDVRLALKLWESLQTHSRIPKLGNKLERQAAACLSVWESCGLLVKIPDRTAAQYKFVTNLNRDAKGKCSECGALIRRSQIELLARLSCPDCHQLSDFVILQRVL